jgi:hypothetical protein
MDSQVAEITEEDDVGVGRLAVHAHATDGVLVHRGRVRLRSAARARNLGYGNIKGTVSRVPQNLSTGVEYVCGPPPELATWGVVILKGLPHGYHKNCQQGRSTSAVRRHCSQPGVWQY